MWYGRWIGWKFRRVAIEGGYERIEGTGQVGEGVRAREAAHVFGMQTVQGFSLVHVHLHCSIISRVYGSLSLPG